MTRALAGIFGEVHGVDVSGEMIARGRQLLAGVPNVHLHRNSGVDLLVLGDLRFDFAFSFIVFQHIPSQAIIGNYIREVQRVLRPGSLFKFQVQGSSQVIACEEDTWIGAPISPPLAVELAERNGFELLRSEGAEEQYFWLWYLKPSRLQMWRKAAEADGWFRGDAAASVLDAAEFAQRQKVARRCLGRLRQWNLNPGPLALLPWPA